MQAKAKTASQYLVVLWFLFLMPKKKQDGLWQVLVLETSKKVVEDQRVSVCVIYRADYSKNAVFTYLYLDKRGGAIRVDCLERRK